MALVVDLVRLDPSLLFTVFAVKFIVPVVHQQLQSYQLPADVSSRIRVIGVGEKDAPDAGSSVAEILAVQIADPYSKLVKQPPSIKCTKTGTNFDYTNIPPPSAVFADLLAFTVPETVSSITPDVKRVSCYIMPAAAFLDCVGEGMYWPMLEERAKTASLLQSRDNTPTLDEIGDNLIARGERLVENSEGVKMYEYERWPQKGHEVYLPLSMVRAVRGTTVTNADVLLVHSTRSFEPKSTRTLTDWHEGKLHKKVFFVGPAARPDISTTVPSLESNPVIDFLNKQPPKSTILVSFGTNFFPVYNWQIETILRTLMETRTPFIFSKASRFSRPLDDRLLNEITSSGIGLALDFVPQREVLAHPSVGLVLGHAGVNGLFESILTGVPSVFWPFIGDQVGQAAYMSLSLDCAWELVQVRTGIGAKQPYRLPEDCKIEGTPEAVSKEFKQVLKDLKSDIGERKRKNLAKLRERTMEELRAGGEVSKELGALLKYVI